MKISNLKTGYIIGVYTKFKLFKPLTWLALIIRCITGLKWNHVQFVVVKYKVPFIHSAEADGVLPFLAMKKLKGKYITIATFGEKYNTEEFAIKVSSKLGVTPYDLKYTLFWQLILHLFDKWIGDTDPKKADDRFACYEHVFWAFDRKKWWSAKPRTLWEHSDLKILFEGKID